MIFDPEKKEVINEYESGNAIGSLLLSDDGKRVYIAGEDGLVFLKSNDSVLVSIDRQDIKRTYYKDYKKLMEEAKKQFPGAALSDEKKTRYNVD